MNFHTKLGHFAARFLVFLTTISFSYSSGLEGQIVFDCGSFKYEINSQGKNLHFIDQTTGIDYLKTDASSYCASVTSNGKEFNASAASRKGNLLKLEFSNSGVTAEIHVESARDGLVFEVIDVKGPAESLTFLHIPLSLEGMPYESFAACALSMNLFTRVRQLPALQTKLQATCYQRFGIKGAKVTILGVPQNQILPAIREVMKNAKDIPFSDKGGAWAQMQKDGYGSYLMNFGTLNEKTVDEWITICKNLGFNQIDSHGGGAGFFKFGDMELDPEKWPDGWETYKRINEKLHAAGISSILHTYAFFIDKNTKYVTPVPSEDLGYFNSFTLARPVSMNDTQIVVNETTANLSMTTGFFVRNSVTLRIGSELIEYTGITNSPPYTFTGCKRGVNGTQASFHPGNEKAFHLKEMFGRFVPGPETQLFRDIARKTSEIVSDCGFDGLYFDAIDGSDILDGDENTWYYSTKFILEVARNLKTPVGMEMSSMAHHWWHYRSRWQAWDRPIRGYKRFIDIHSAAIKLKEYEHGLWSGYSPMIDKYASLENGGLLLPLHFGWWGFQSWNSPQGEPTFPDDIEYLCCKMLGNNAGLSMLGGVDEKSLKENPGVNRLIPIIRQYEELLNKSYFSDSVRILLRQPGKEFSLFQEPGGSWNFKPVTYQKHKVAGSHHSSAKWTVNNEYDSQPVKLRIESLMSVKPYDNQENKLLTDFSSPKDFVNDTSATGVSGELLRAGEKAPNGEPCGVFTARSNGTSVREGSWIKMEEKFEPWLDLSKNQALGLWIKGDGNGELLNFRLESPKHISFGARGDHFVKIDFTGWRYFELVEIESSEFSNYIWPATGFYVYDSYRHTVEFKSVDKLQIWYNNLPAGKEVTCLIGPVKALPMVTLSIRNPSVTIGGAKIVFMVVMEPGMYLEFKSLADCKLYGSNGEFLRDVKIEGSIPNIVSGKNEISFNCDDQKEINSRVQVTVISEGDPLECN